MPDKKAGYITHWVTFTVRGKLFMSGHLTLHGEVHDDKRTIGPITLLDRDGKLATTPDYVLELRNELYPKGRDTRA